MIENQDKVVKSILEKSHPLNLGPKEIVWKHYNFISGKILRNQVFERKYQRTFLIILDH